MAERQWVPLGASIRAILEKASHDWGGNRAWGGADDGKPKATTMDSVEIISAYPLIEKCSSWYPSLQSSRVEKNSHTLAAKKYGEEFINARK